MITLRRFLDRQISGGGDRERGDRRRGDTEREGRRREGRRMGVGRGGVEEGGGRRRERGMYPKEG